MTNSYNLQCKECRRPYSVAKPAYVCDFCFGALEVSFDYAEVARTFTKRKIKSSPLTIWRYADLLPIDSEEPIDLGAGMTPLLRADNLGKALGLRNLWIKNDSANPTQSFKDRAVSVAATKAREFGISTLACASTGNLAGSTAAHGAKANMETFVFVPADLEQGKIIGSAVFGSVVLTKGNYDDVNRLCVELAETLGWAFVNINMRPYYAEGSKTIAYEIAEQLGWRTPRNIIVPVASGCLFTKVWKGFRELEAIGLISKNTAKLHIAQPSGCSPVAAAFLNGCSYPSPVRPNTVAKSLAIGNPADGGHAIRIASESGGTAAIVPEEEVSRGITLLAETEGIFAETAGGVVISALAQLAANGYIDPDEETVALITGSGLKTLEALEGVRPRFKIDPSIASFNQAKASEKLFEPVHS